MPYFWKAGVSSFLWKALGLSKLWPAEEKSL